MSDINRDVLQIRTTGRRNVWERKESEKKYPKTEDHKSTKENSKSQKLVLKKITC